MRADVNVDEVRGEVQTKVLRTPSSDLAYYPLKTLTMHADCQDITH